MSTIPALKQQTEALAAQAATMNPRTMSKEEKASFMDSVDKVERLVYAELEKISNQRELVEKEINYNCDIPLDEKKKVIDEKVGKLLEDRTPFCALNDTLYKIKFPYGATPLIVKTSMGNAQLEVANTATVKELKAAAAKAAHISVESIKNVVIDGIPLPDDEEFMARYTASSSIWIF